MENGRAETRWLTADEQAQWRSLLALVMLLPPALDLQLKRDAGINGFEYHVMSSLSAAPDRCRSMSELAALAQSSLSRLSHAVSRLEKAGWVVRRTTDGGRRVEARLTDAGQAKMAETAPGHVQEARRLVIDALTREQLQALGATARAIVAGIDEQVCRVLVRGPGPEATADECAAATDAYTGAVVCDGDVACGSSVECTGEDEPVRAG